MAWGEDPPGRPTLGAAHADLDLPPLTQSLAELATEPSVPDVIAIGRQTMSDNYRLPTLPRENRCPRTRLSNTRVGNQRRITRPQAIVDTC